MEDFQDFTDAQKEQFRYLVSLLPESEQYLYLAERKYLPSDEYFENFAIETGVLSVTEDEKSFILPSAGMRDAFGLSTYGIESYVRPTNRLGRLKIPHIREGGISDERFAATDYRHTPAYVDIHGHKDVSPLIAFAHDLYHAKVMSRIPPEIRRSIQRIVDVGEKATGFETSRELWDLTDSEIKYFGSEYKIVANIKKMSKAFSQMLYGDAKLKESDIFFHWKKSAPGKITWLLALTLIDLSMHPIEWEKNKINGKYFIDSMQEHYKEIQSILPDIIYDTYKIKLLKYFLYVESKVRGKEKEFPELAKYIDQHRNHFEKYIEFHKVKNTTNERTRNTIVMHYRNYVLYQDKEKTDTYDEMMRLMRTQDAPPEPAINTEMRRIFDTVHNDNRTLTENECKLILMSVNKIVTQFSDILSKQTFFESLTRINDYWNKTRIDIVKGIFNSDLSADIKMIVLFAICKNLPEDLLNKIKNEFIREANMPIDPTAVEKILLNFVKSKIPQEMTADDLIPFLTTIGAKISAGEYPQQEIKDLEVFIRQTKIETEEHVQGKGSQMSV